MVQILHCSENCKSPYVALYVAVVPTTGREVIELQGLRTCRGQDLILERCTMEADDGWIDQGKTQRN